MRAEVLIPVVLGVLFGVVGLAVLLDAWIEDGTVVSRERRRQPRLERHRGGEAAVGLGVLAVAAAFLGRDVWRYSVVAAIAGAALLLVGTWLNRQFLSQAVSNRGALRRRPDLADQTVSKAREGAPPTDRASEPRNRIR